MAIQAPIAGAYTGTWNGGSFYYTRQGYNLHFSQKGEASSESDLYGLCLIELIGRGASMRLDCIGKVYASSTVAAMWQWGGGVFGQVYAASPSSPIGRLGTTVAQALVLTVVPGTPAAGNPNTVTIPKSITSPDQDLSLVFNSTLREVPLSFDSILTDSAGTGSLFVAA
jgi:hypothetical protein